MIVATLRHKRHRDVSVCCKTLKLGNTAQLSYLLLHENFYACNTKHSVKAK